MRKIPELSWQGRTTQCSTLTMHVGICTSPKRCGRNMHLPDDVCRTKADKYLGSAMLDESLSLPPLLQGLSTELAPYRTDSNGSQLSINQHCWGSPNPADRRRERTVFGAGPTSIAQPGPGPGPGLHQTRLGPGSHPPWFHNTTTALRRVDPGAHH